MAAQPRNNGNRSTNRVGATVSRRLRAANWNISPAARKYKASGMFVTGFPDGSVTVLVDLGLDAKNVRVADQVAAELRTWDQVTGVAVSPSETGAVFVRLNYSVAVRNATLKSLLTF